MDKENPTKRSYKRKSDEPLERHPRGAYKKSHPVYQCAVEGCVRSAYIRKKVPSGKEKCREHEKYDPEITGHTVKDKTMRCVKCDKKSMYKRKVHGGNILFLCKDHGNCTHHYHRGGVNRACMNRGSHEDKIVDSNGVISYVYRCVNHRICQTPSCNNTISYKSKTLCKPCLDISSSCKYVGCTTVLKDGGFCEFHQSRNRCNYDGCYCNVCGRGESYCMFHRKYKAHGEAILRGFEDDQYVGDDVDLQKWFEFLKEEQLCTRLMTYNNGGKKLCCFPNFLPVTDKCWIHMPEDKLQESYDHVFGERVSCVCSVDGCTQVALNRGARVCTRHAQEQPYEYKTELNDLFHKIPGSNSRIII